MSNIRISSNYFPKGNPWTESTSPWTVSGAGPRSPSRGRLTGERPERRPRARNLTAVEEKWRETEVSLTGCKRGWRRVEHDRATVGNDRWRRRSMEWALQTQKQAIEGEVSVVMAGGCSSPICSGRGGAHRGRGGGNGRQ
jgi:hypothetical protein